MRRSPCFTARPRILCRTGVDDHRFPNLTTSADVPGVRGHVKAVGNGHDAATLLDASLFPTPLNGGDHSRRGSLSIGKISGPVIRKRLGPKPGLAARHDEERDVIAEAVVEVAVVRCSFLHSRSAPSTTPQR